jgi:hypothetical protein
MDKGQEGHVSHFFITGIKYLREINLKEERFILVHSFRDFSSCSLALLFLGSGKAERHGRENMWRRWLSF